MTEVTKSEGKKKKQTKKESEASGELVGHHQTDQYNYYGHYRRKKGK